MRQFQAETNSGSANHELTYKLRFDPCFDYTIHYFGNNFKPNPWSREMGWKILDKAHVQSFTE